MDKLKTMLVYILLAIFSPFILTGLLILGSIILLDNVLFEMFQIIECCLTDLKYKIYDVRETFRKKDRK